MDGGNNKLAAIMEKLNNIDWRITKMGKSIHAIQVGCNNCKGPHLRNECDLDENGNQKFLVYYSSGDCYDEDWRKPRK